MEHESDESMAESGAYVSWKAFVSIGLPAIAVPVVVTWALLVLHSAQPHAGAVRTHELSGFSAQMESLKSEMREIRRILIENQYRAPWRDRGSGFLDVPESHSEKEG